jgi:hypothetical protein
MDHASEYSHKLVSSEEEAAVRARYGITPASRPTLTSSWAKRKEDEMYLMVFPGLVPAATCGLNREHFLYDNCVGDRKPHDPGALQVQTRPDGALTGTLPCWRLLWPT